MLRNVVPAISKCKSEMRELTKDLTRMGWKGLLAKPWNLRNEAVLRKILVERRNQWERTMRQDLE